MQNTVVGIDYGTLNFAWADVHYDEKSITMIKLYKTNLTKHGAHRMMNSMELLKPGLMNWWNYYDPPAPGTPPHQPIVFAGESQMKEPYQLMEGFVMGLCAKKNWHYKRCQASAARLLFGARTGKHGDNKQVSRHMLQILIDHPPCDLFLWSPGQDGKIGDDMAYEPRDWIRYACDHMMDALMMALYYMNLEGMPQCREIIRLISLCEHELRGGKLHMTMGNPKKRKAPKEKAESKKQRAIEFVVINQENV